MFMRCLVHALVRTPMYGLPLSQSDQRIPSVFQSVYNKAEDELDKKTHEISYSGR